MSVTTYQVPAVDRAFFPDSKALAISVHELPTMDTKPQIKLVVTPILPYDERLRKFLERPAPEYKTTPTLTQEEKEEPLCQPAETKTEEDIPMPPQEAAQLSKRERLNRWWQKEKAEQKAFRNAMAPYIAF